MNTPDPQLLCQYGNLSVLRDKTAGKSSLGLRAAIGYLEAKGSAMKQRQADSQKAQAQAMNEAFRQLELERMDRMAGQHLRYTRPPLVLTPGGWGAGMPIGLDQGMARMDPPMPGGGYDEVAKMGQELAKLAVGTMPGGPTTGQLRAMGGSRSAPTMPPMGGGPKFTLGMGAMPKPSTIPAMPAMAAVTPTPGPTLSAAPKRGPGAPALQHTPGAPATTPKTVSGGSSNPPVAKAPPSPAVPKPVAGSKTPTLQQAGGAPAPLAASPALSKPLGPGPSRPAPPPGFSPSMNSAPPAAANGAASWGGLKGKPGLASPAPAPLRMSAEGSSKSPWGAYRTQAPDSGASGAPPAAAASEPTVFNKLDEDPHLLRSLMLSGAMLGTGAMVARGAEALKDTMQQEPGQSVYGTPGGFRQTVTPWGY